MMPFRPSRERRGSDRFLHLKMILLALGACIAVAGFVLRIDWLVTAAIVPLVIGVGLSLGRRPGDDTAADDRTDPQNDG